MYKEIQSYFSQMMYLMVYLQYQASNYLKASNYLNYFYWFRLTSVLVHTDFARWMIFY